MIRSESKRARASQLGAEPVIADALDRAQVEAAVRQATPEVIVNQLTAIGRIDTRHFERSFAATDRLRIEGTDNLLAAARATGVRRFVAQSNGAFTNSRTGGPVKNEQDPLDRSPVGPHDRRPRDDVPGANPGSRLRRADAQALEQAESAHDQAVDLDRAARQLCS